MEDREDRYRKRLKEQRLREVRFNRMILVIILGVTLIAGGAALLFGIGSLMNSGDKMPDQGEDTRVAGSTRIASETAIASVNDESKTAVPASGAAVKKKVKAEKPEPEKTVTKEAADNISELSGTAINKYFKGAAFIGDSRTQGLQINSGVTSADFLAGRGLNVKTVYTEKVINGNMTVLDALRRKKYTKIYICYGLNELGWAYSDLFIKDYMKLIKDIEKSQPKADIVVESILPVTKKKASSDKIFNMKHINRYNRLIKTMCRKQKITFINLAPSVRNQAGYLPAEATTDGIHMNKEYCRKVISYIAMEKY